MDLNEYTSAEAFLKDLPVLALPFRDKLRQKDETFAFQLGANPVRYVNVKDGLLELSSQASAEPVSAVIAKEQDLMNLLSGKTSPMKLLMFGGIRVRGSKTELLRLLAMLDA